MSVSNNTQAHSPYLQSNLRKPGHTDYPADLLKFNAWIGKLRDEATGKALVNYDKAVEIILSKKLVLGEPAVVPIIYTHLDKTETVELVFAIGSADANHPFIWCSVNNSISNEALIDLGEVDDEGNKVFTPLIEVLNNFLSKEDALEQIKEGLVEAINDSSVLNKISTVVAGSDIIHETIIDKLKWHPIRELLEGLDNNDEKSDEIQ